jgi:putative ABC transport system permease protein
LPDWELLLQFVYPAFYISSFSPINVHKDSSLFKGSGKLSNVLLTLQFTISITALVMGIVFAKNAEFQNTVDLGYDMDEVIVLNIAPELFTSFKNEIITNPKIISTGGTDNHIGFGNYRRPVKDNEKQLEVDVLDIGPTYAQTMGLRLAEGRLFDELRLVADRATYIL